jgi:tetratricopeptide (TPR) repeat protein
VLLYVWVRKTWSNKELLPLFVAGVFAMHPMHVEAVVWISSRKNVLFLFFYFLGLLKYHDYSETKESKYLVITWLFFVLSILSKPTAVIFPIHLLLIDYLKGREFSIKVILEKVPFLLGSILAGIATILVQTDAGAVSIEAYSIVERVQLASYAINLYLIKFFAPINLSSFYPYPTRPFIAFVSLAPILMSTVLGVTLWYWRKSRTLVFGVLFFLISLALLVQLVTVGSVIISERYTDLAYVGLSISVFILLEDLIFNRIGKEKIAQVLIIGSVFVLALLTFKRVKVWENGETLWTDAIEKFPEVAGSWGGRGVYYRLEKKYTKALRDLNQAVILNPNEAMFYSNRGNIYFDLGKDDQALNDYNNCIRLDASDENAFANRGAIYGRKGQYQDAIKDLSNAILLDPEFVNAFMNRGIIYSQLNRRIEAKSDFNNCLVLTPDNDEIWNALAVEHQHLGEFDSSIIVLNKAIELKANLGVYYFNRGISYRLMGMQNEAVSDFNQAQSLGVLVDPGYYQAVN